MCTYPITTPVVSAVNNDLLFDELPLGLLEEKYGDFPINQEPVHDAPTLYMDAANVEDIQLASCQDPVKEVNLGTIEEPKPILLASWISDQPILLDEPSEKLPAIFPSGSLFDRFPYALPSVCISVIPLLGFVSCIWLPESLHNHTKSVRKFDNEVLSKASDGRVDGSENAVVEDGLIDKFGSEDNDVNKQLWMNWGFVAAVILNALWILHTMAFAETFPLWAVSSEAYGGLDFTTSEVADVLALGGAALLMLQLFLFPRIVKAFGTIQVLRLSMFLTTVIIATYPLMGRLQGITLWAVLLPVSVIISILSGCSMTGGYILINNAVVTAQRGVANGVATSIMAAFQAIGPACAGSIFTWSEGRMDAFFLPGMWMVFSILSALSFFAFLATLEPFLPASLNYPLQEG